MVLKILCEVVPLPCSNRGQGKGRSLSSGGKKEVFQPTALHYRQSELSVGNGIQNRRPATAIQINDQAMEEQHRPVVSNQRCS